MSKIGSTSFKEELQSIRSLVDKVAIALVKWTISGLNNPLLKDIHESTLERMGAEAIPGLIFYLIEQAALERDLVNDLVQYYNTQKIFKNERYKILTKRTIPQYLGSDEIVYELLDCEERMERNKQNFLKRWGHDPTEFTGYVNPKAGPNRENVEGAIWALGKIGGAKIVSFLNRLAKQVETIKQIEVPNGYCSVLTKTYEALILIQKKEI